MSSVSSSPDIGEYDLVVNTDRMGIDGAVDTILRASKDLK